MVAVARDSEGTRSQDGDVVRLRRVRDARPALGERILVRELGHVRRGAVDLVQILVLHEHDDELIEVAGGLGRNGHRADRMIGSAQGENPGGQETREYEKGGRKEGDERAVRP